MSETEERAQVEIARLFGMLLLRELDRAGIERLQQPELAAALAELGVNVPTARDRAELDELASQFYATLVRPERGGPLVQSLWEGGQYEGEPAVLVRRLAEAAGLELDREWARGAPHDHLGSVLMLWADTRTRAPEVAERLEREHIAWSIAPLEHLAAGAGFYPELCGALASWLRLVGGSA